MAALIDLKLSQNTRFEDRPGACKLIETAAGPGDRTVTQRLAQPVEALLLQETPLE
jgi:hypothetical protein